jgi:hypothetical protein
MRHMVVLASLLVDLVSKELLHASLQVHESGLPTPIIRKWV